MKNRSAAAGYTQSANLRPPKRRVSVVEFTLATDRQAVISQHIPNARVLANRGRTWPKLG
jgi:hypothetical protein